MIILLTVLLVVLALALIGLVLMQPDRSHGMAGSFGYEKEHYDFSMAVGELTLFPAVRQAAGHSPSEKTNVIVCAPGTSCRQQIFDGTGVIALHPVQALLKACK